MQRYRTQEDQVRNRALVVSMETFRSGVPLRARPGAKGDAKRLHRTLSKLGFKVEVHSDLDAEEIYQLMETESRRPVQDLFLCVLSSHGQQGCVFGHDGIPVHLSRVYRCFNNQVMEGKAKLFLVQACRGGAVDDGVEVDSACDSDSSGFNFSEQFSVPEDTAVMYATAPGYGAFMNPVGSVFLGTFCQLLQDEGTRCLDLTRLLTRLSQQVAFSFQSRSREVGLHQKKQMPCLVTRLTRDVYLSSQSTRDTTTKMSATDLIPPEARRGRTPSIS